MEPTEFDRSKIRALIAEGRYAFSEGPHPERAQRDAETLLLFVLRRTDPERNAAWLITHANSPTMQNAGAQFRALVQRRLAGEPIQYITGVAEFYGLPFRVNRQVLVPRPETEHLVEKAIALAAGMEHPRIVEVGTGSGAIAIALAKHVPAARIWATEISAAALAVARVNAERHAVADRVRFLEGDMLAPAAGETFHIVVSNPPYVPTADRNSLDAEVRDFEPEQALFAGADGLDAIRRLIPAAFAALAPGGFIALEIGYGQRAAVEGLLSRAGFEETVFTEDLQKIPRVAAAMRP